MKYGSVCSGIEAASVAWHPLGWQAVWLAEIEPFPAAVLVFHYPEVPNLGDMTRIARRVLSGDIDAPDVLVGGTPCQAFSVAGLRQGLEDARGRLTIRYVELADAIDFVRRRSGQPATIIVWENVPGVLSSKDNAFGCFLAALAGEDDVLEPPGDKWANAGCVFGPARTVAWRTLDAQYFGVAQRRRVFLVASARKDFNPAAVLFEFDSVRRDTAPSREAGQKVAGTLTRCTFAGGPGGRVDSAIQGHFQLVAGTLQANGKASGSATQQDAEAGLLVPVGYRMAGFGQYTNDETASTIKARDFKNATDLAVVPEVVEALVANQGTIKAEQTGSGQSMLECGNVGVRRLTPIECERLQGFPDNYTLVPYRNKPAADGPRYKALGNAMAVPCMTFIGKRIDRQINAKAANSSTPHFKDAA
jgi:DNA (cytosine-5)-methyltransferase 1